LGALKSLAVVNGYSAEFFGLGIWARSLVTSYTPKNVNL